MMIDIYVYPNTNVLKNKFQETNPEKLVKLETKIVTTRFIDYQKSNHTDFSFKGLKKIHKYLFGDIYDWAGKERTVNIAKDNSMFCNVLHISTFAENIFQKLNKEDATKLSREDFCNKISNLYSDLNALHPFREGNGRVQALFIYHFAKQAGYELDLYSNTDRTEIIEASKHGMLQDNTKIRELILKNIKLLPNNNKESKKNSLQEKFSKKIQMNKNERER